MLIDTHAHLTFKDFADDLEGVVARAAEARVTRIITIGTSLESSRHAVELAEKYPGVFATVGIHPDNAVKVPPDFIASLRALARSPRVVAIGEIGLDYFRRSQERIAAEKSIQAAVFTQQLELAGELGLNVEIHERDAWDDLLALLAPFAGGVRGQFHCFSKSLAHAEAVIAHGHFVSFTGIATFKNASVVQDTAARVSPGSFMVETDCPYLAPVPFRGKRNQPAYVQHVAAEIARLRGIAPEEVARATTDNFFRLFKIDSAEIRHVQ
jgi:TatD DNase family protein